VSDAVKNDLRIYDDHAGEWWDGSVRWLRTLHNLVPARMRYFDQFVEDWQDRSVLDAGCGGGFMAEALAKRGARVTGVDPAADAISAARSHALSEGLEIDYQVGTVEALPFADNSFDHVVCVDVLEHVEDVPRAIDEIARVLKPGGMFFFDTINRNSVASFLAVTCAERLVGLLPRGTHDPQKFIRPSELEAELHGRDFHDVRFAGLGPVGLNRRIDLVFGRLPTTLVQYMGCARLGAPA